MVGRRGLPAWRRWRGQRGWRRLAWVPAVVVAAVAEVIVVVLVRDDPGVSRPAEKQQRRWLRQADFILALWRAKQKEGSPSRGEDGGGGEEEEGRVFFRTWEGERGILFWVCWRCKAGLDMDGGGGGGCKEMAACSGFAAVALSPPCPRQPLWLSQGGGLT